jgi:hypothetical protein
MPAALDQCHQQVEGARADINRRAGCQQAALVRL